MGVVRAGGRFELGKLHGACGVKVQLTPAGASEGRQRDRVGGGPPWGGGGHSVGTVCATALGDDVDNLR